MTELRTLIDEWLDELSPAAPLDRPGALGGLHAREVAEAVRTGRRRRRRQRAMALAGVAAAVMAVTVLAGLVNGVGSVTTVPRPPAGTTSPQSSATAGPAATSSTGAVSPTPGVTPVTVTYPDGGGGTRSITWPLPASGIPWAASAGPYPITAVSTQGALALERSLRAALPDLPLQSHQVDDVATLGVVDGHATGYFAQVRTVAVHLPAWS